MGEGNGGILKGKRRRTDDADGRFVGLVQPLRKPIGFGVVIYQTLMPASFTQGSHGGDSRNKGETSHNVTNVIKV